MTGTGRPPLAGDERESLAGFLALQRERLRRKAAGLDAEQLRTPLPPSTLTLAGLLKHLALVEDHWFVAVFEGDVSTEPWASVDWDADPDWELHTAVDDRPEDLVALYDAAVAASERVLERNPDLGRLAARPGHHGEYVSLRWILLHMIEEYARHLGHADLIRESLDGQTGD